MPHLDTIPIPAAEASGEPWQAPLWADYYIRAALDEAAYEPDELPADALPFADLWTYHGEQQNGGHAQYIGNTEGQHGAWARAAALLGRMGLPGYQALLGDVTAFAIANEDRINDLYFAGEDMAARELFYEFDDRFAELQQAGPDLTLAMRDWLLRQPWLRLDPDQPHGDMGWLRASLPPHPLKAERDAARLRDRLIS